jgi:hypothetical protein
MRHETARLRALNLFCGAGGARGLQQANQLGQLQPVC